jgi:hypothetical protein
MPCRILDLSSPDFGVQVKGKANPKTTVDQDGGLGFLTRGATGGLRGDDVLPARGLGRALRCRRPAP